MRTSFVRALFVFSGAALMMAAVPSGATPTTGAGSFHGHHELLAQADEPAPIAVELLTGRAEFPDQVGMSWNIELDGSDAIVLESTELSRTVVAKITVQPGAQFPWHTHPGPVLVNIVEGELVYVPANDCSEHHYEAATAFWDPGRGNVHTAYNPGETVMVMLATFFEVPAEGPLTITDGVVQPEDCDVELGQAASH